MDDKSKWIATVRNNNPEGVVFTAIDKCVIKDNEYLGRGRCDCMLTTSKSLYLIELKEQLPPWQADALAQLTSIINFLMENHDISQYKIRKVFACNKKREQFIAFNNEENQRFIRETTFRKDFQTEVIVL